MLPAVIEKSILSFTRRATPRLRSVYLPSLGQRLELPGLASSVYQQIFIMGEYRPVRALPPGARIIDLGAFLGLFSIYAARICQGARITAVEANPKTIPALTANIKAQGGRNGAQIDIRAEAVSDHRGTLQFTMSRNDDAHVAGTAYRHTDDFTDHDQLVTVEVPCVPFSDYLQEPVDFLKCDVEGAEYAALGSIDLTPALIREAVIEFHDLDRNSKALFDLLEKARSAGYRIHAVDGRPFTGDSQIPTADSTTLHLVGL